MAQHKTLKIIHCFTFCPSAAEATVIPANLAPGGCHVAFWLGGAHGNVTLSQRWIGWDEQQRHLWCGATRVRTEFSVQSLRTFQGLQGHQKTKFKEGSKKFIH